MRWNRRRFAGVQGCMGQPDVARVDVAALHAVARQYETAANIVDAAVRTHLTGLVFDGATAGRPPRARGGPPPPAAAPRPAPPSPMARGGAPDPAPRAAAP